MHGIYSPISHRDQLLTLKCPSHSTLYRTTSSSRDKGGLTLGVGDSSKWVSMLNLWVYENGKEGLTFAEQLQKKNREAENSRL